MTKISMIRGVNNVMSIDIQPTEKKIIDIPYINYSAMTAGELSAVLTKERAKLLLSEYPDSPLANDWRKGISMLDNFLYKGVHNAGVSVTGLFSSAEMDKFATVLTKAKKRSNPAAFEFLSDTRKIGDPLIPIADDPCKPFREGTYGQRPDPAKQLICEKQISMQRILNDPKIGLDKNAMYMCLYEFVSPEDYTHMANTRPDTGFKIARHRMVIPEFADITGLSAYNLRNWMDLAIRRGAASKDLGAKAPAEYIEYLKTGVDPAKYNPTTGERINGLKELERHLYNNMGGTVYIEGIGDPFTITALTIKFVLAIAAAIIALGIAITGIIQACKGNEPTAFDRVAGITTAAVHAAKSLDWPGREGEGEGQDTDPAHTCPNGQRWSSVLNMCTPVTQCPPGQAYDPVTRGCKAVVGTQCPPGNKWDAPTASCVPEDPTDPALEASAGNKNMIIAAAAAAGLYFLATK